MGARNLSGISNGPKTMPKQMNRTDCQRPVRYEFERLKIDQMQSQLVQRRSGCSLPEDCQIA